MVRWSSLWSIVAGTVGCQRWRRLAVVAFAATVFVTAHGLPPSHRLRVLGYALTEQGATVLVSVLGEEPMLQYRAHRTIAIMGREVDRLQWIEAESGVKHRRMAEMTALLEKRRAALEEEAGRLAQLVATGQDTYTVDGQPIAAEELRDQTEEAALELESLQIQTALSGRTADLYAQSEREARILRRRAEQSEERILAYLTLLDASDIQAKTRTIGGAGLAIPVRDSPAMTMSDLEAEIRRTQQITEMRHRLAAGLETGNLSSLPASDLAMPDRGSIGTLPR